jgi:hypothetical protein
MRIDEWSDELIAEAVKAKDDYNILQKERLVKGRIAGNEYPMLGETIERKWPKHKSSRQRYKKDN